MEELGAHRVSVAAVGDDKTAELAVEQHIVRRRRRPFGQLRILGEEHIERHAQIAIAELEVVKANGIVELVEVRDYVLANVHYLHAVVLDVRVTVLTADQVVGGIGQLDIVVPGEKLVVKVLFGNEPAPLVRKAKLDFLLHDSLPIFPSAPSIHARTLS